MIRIHEILDKVSSYMSQDESALIQKAYVYSAAAHAGQTRLSGEPYLSHPLEVANILAEMQLDAATICAGLLHDTVEDTKATVDEIEERFGEDVADIVDGVTKISLINFQTKEAQQAENIRKMILAMAEDIRVLLVKLADRLHNMRTLGFQESHKQRLIAQETLDIYAPLSNRLGLYRIKSELEDLCLNVLRPDAYIQILDGVQEYQTSGHEYLAKVCTILEDMLKTNSIKGRVRGRTKHIYSIFHKMQQQGLTLDQVYDIMAFRVIVATIRDCYSVLGLVHSVWKPVPGRFKDYISMPKANLYQSLHTTVIGPDGERIEIQIRTEEMHKLAENGVAAHWHYKEAGKGNQAGASAPKKTKDMDRFTWLRQILDWQRELSDPGEFMSSLRIDLFQDEVFVFTPKGDVKELPEGATPVDFAYHIHSQVGDHCSGAKVNGRLVPLSTSLKNGDTVEIITDSDRHPSRDWLAFVKTAKASTRIKHWIRTEERSKAIALAKEMLEKEGRKLGVNYQKLLKDGSLLEVATDLGFSTVDELLALVGYSKITPRRLLKRFLPEPEQDQADAKGTDKTSGKPQTPAEKAKADDEAKSKASEHVKIKGVDDVLIRFAGCCDPLPGEAIIGYISRGRGVTVHTADCPNLSSFEPERLMSIQWEGQKDRPYPAKMRIVCRNQKGMLASLSEMLAKEDVNIDSGTFSSLVDGTTELIFTVEVRDSAHLYLTIDRLRKVPNVLEVQRMSSSMSKTAG